MDPTEQKPDIRELYRKYVPEVAAGIVEIMSVAREPGRFAMVAVRSHDPRINAVSACVGNDGACMKTIVSELRGGRVCVILWSESVQEFIAHTMLPRPRSRRPRRPPKITLDEVAHQAHVQVEPETVEHMTSQDGLLLKLACRLVGWDIKLSSFDKRSSR